MKGFSFLQDYCDRDLWEVIDDLRIRERDYYSGFRQRIQSAGAGLNRILEHRKTLDMVFITAFRTGEDASAGGYAGYQEGEKDSLGNVHVAGDHVSKKENIRRNRSLAEELHLLGYGFIHVEGRYDGKSENSYCVVNKSEDTEIFIKDMQTLAHQFGQDSILVAPKLESVYLLYFNGGKSFIGDDVKIGDALADYTGIKGKKFTFSSVGGFPKGDSLTPLRCGKDLLVIQAARSRILKERNVEFLASCMGSI